MENNNIDLCVRGSASGSAGCNTPEHMTQSPSAGYVGSFLLFGYMAPLAVIQVVGEGWKDGSRGWAGRKPAHHTLGKGKQALICLLLGRGQGYGKVKLCLLSNTTSMVCRLVPARWPSASSVHPSCVFVCWTACWPLGLSTTCALFIAYIALPCSSILQCLLGVQTFNLSVCYRVTVLRC